jgi:hypothetical protein
MFTNLTEFSEADWRLSEADNKVARRLPEGYHRFAQAIQPLMHMNEITVRYRAVAYCQWLDTGE